MRGIVAITAAVFVGACSLGSLSGFSSGGVASPDAAVADDGSADGAVVESGIVTDGATGDAGPLDCDAGNYLLCAKFDDGDLANGWTEAIQKFGGTVSPSNDARSAPYSLRSQLTPSSSSDNQYARLFKKLAFVVPLRIAFDLKVAQSSMTGQSRPFFVFEVYWPTTNNSTYFFREYDGSTLTEEQNGKYNLVETLPYDRWVRVVIEIDPTAPAGRLRLSYDGRTVLEKTAVPFEAPTTPSTEIYLGLGRLEPPGPSLEAVFDNVTIEQIP